VTKPVDLAQLAAELKAETAGLKAETANLREPEPSEPTTFIGAPDVGIDWAAPRPAAWRAFGEDA
jgi:hypothetical protein